MVISAASWASDLDDGFAAFQAQDYKTALQKLLPLAKKGNTDAEMLVSLIYLSQKNNTEAVKWIVKAAKQGDPVAQRSLGEAYKMGNAGLEKNSETAAMWLTRAANQNEAEAQYMLASLYISGDGVDKNFKQSMFWLKKSAGNGYQPAIEQLNKWESQNGQ